MKRITSVLIIALLTLSFIPAMANEIELELTCESGILMEASTGKILYEKNINEKRPIASVTKIMTALLIMEAIDKGDFTYNDMVTVSEYAASMGGSQVYLKVGEQMSVNDMLKAIMVVSGNDACAAMAEHVAGTIEGFVALMNERAAELGMTNTHFVNSNGLDVADHYSSAKDVAIMSRELLKHKEIKKYSTIWIDNLRDGAFQLSNTNKLVHSYEGTTGLKTGFTTTAKHCVSASASREGMDLIAVVLAAPSSNDRFSDAKKLLDYGFKGFKIKEGVKAGEEVGEAMVEKGQAESVKIVSTADLIFLDSKKSEADIKKVLEVPQMLSAPVVQGQIVGKLKFYKNDEMIGEVDVAAKDAVERKTLFDIFSDSISKWLFI